MVAFRFPEGAQIVSRKPRLDQVAAMTAGVTLPLTGVPDHVLQEISENLRIAFSGVRTNDPGAFSDLDEVETTQLLESKLNEWIADGGLLADLVLAVARGKEFGSFDAGRLELRPDLSIYLKDVDPRFPLLAEAKILDAAASKTVRLYCENGIRRFVEGDYAWANREALMLGYVRDGSTINDTLKPYLSTHADKYQVARLPAIAGGSGPDLAHSSHDRTFVYPLQPHPGPGPIALWHLWLS